MSDHNPNRRKMIAGAAAGAAVATFGFTRPALAAADPAKIVTLTATMDIAEGKRDEAIAYLDAMTAAVKEREPGTLAYAAHTYKSDPNKVIFFEVYESQAAIAKHNPAAAAKEAGLSGEGLFASPPKIDLLDRIGGFIRW